MARYVGLWHGGINYGMPDAGDAEWFGSIREAANVMSFRRDSGYHVRSRFRYVYRDTAYELTPGAHDDASGSIRLFRVSDDISTERLFEYLECEGYPDRELTIGPRGGIRCDRC